MPTTTFIRSGSPPAAGSVAHNLNSATLTNTFGLSLERWQPAHPLHGQFDLPHAAGQRHIQGSSCTGADDAVVPEAVAPLEALDGVDEDGRVCDAVDDRVLRQVAEGAQAGCQRRDALPLIARLNLWQFLRQRRKALWFASFRAGPVQGERTSRPVVVRHCGGHRFERGRQPLAVSHRRHHRREVQIPGAVVVSPIHRRRIDAPFVDGVQDSDHRRAHAEIEQRPVGAGGVGTAQCRELLLERRRVVVGGIEAMFSRGRQCGNRRLQRRDGRRAIEPEQSVGFVRIERLQNGYDVGDPAPFERWVHRCGQHLFHGGCHVCIDAVRRDRPRNLGFGDRGRSWPIGCLLAPGRCQQPNARGDDS